MSEKPSPRLEYTDAWFVDREAAIHAVMERASALRQGNAVEKRTVIFTGEGGIGKSWLLRRLETKLKQIEGLTVFLLDLDKYKERDPLFGVMEILKAFSDGVLDGETLPGANPADSSRVLMPLVARKLELEKRQLVVLVDTVYESDWRLLAALEDYLLGPLAIQPRVLLVLAGRGRLYPWKTPELRLKAHFEELKPFTPNDTVEQLKTRLSTPEEEARAIYKVTGGNPEANALVARSEDRTAGLNEAIEATLEIVPDDARAKLRQHLEALCVLRSFDEERIQAMLPVYYGDTHQQWSYAQARDVRQSIIQTAFAHWDETEGGYVMDGSTRGLLDACLLKAQRSRWVELQRAAHDLYLDWCREYPRSKERWKKEAKYHGDRLLEEGVPVEDRYSSQAETLRLGHQEPVDVTTGPSHKLY